MCPILDALLAHLDALSGKLTISQWRKLSLEDLDGDVA
jgi:hypothetical protein